MSVSDSGVNKKISKDKFKQVILSDYRLVSEVRESGAQGRRDVLSGKGSFGIFGGINILFGERISSSS